eukprot:SAG31_NODE_1015_length_10366_cov_47.726113_3_plen_55_part_00
MYCCIASGDPRYPIAGGQDTIIKVVVTNAEGIKNMLSIFSGPVPIEVTIVTSDP